MSITLSKRTLDDIEYDALQAVYRIPPEILTEIFLYCHHDNSVYTSRTEAPFNLFSTCQRWRAVTLSIPLLWSTFNVVFVHNASRPSLPVLNLWLDRSKMWPLSFSLMYQGTNANLEEDHYTMSKLFRPLETLLVHLSRWRNVYLDFSDLPPNAQFAPYVPSENLMLEKFAMRTFKFHPRFASYELISTYMDWISSLAEYSPALRDFASYGTGHISRLSGFNSFYSVPWKSLTTLKLEHVSETLALYILQRSSSLISCDLTGLAHYPDWIPDLQHAAPQLREEIVLPKLRALSVTAEQDIDRFWGHLILPNLEELEIWMLSSARQWHQGEELVQFLRRSGSVAVVDSDMVTPTSFLTHGSLTSTRGPPISRLVLRNCNMRSRLASVARLLSDSLRDLRVIDTALLDDAFMELLTFPERIIEQIVAPTAQSNVEQSMERKETALCPRLEQLTLRRCITASDGRTSQMIQSRVLLPVADSSHGGDDESESGVCKLRSVRLEFSNPDHAEDVDLLREMYKAGLDGEVVMQKGVSLSYKKVKSGKMSAHVPVLDKPSSWA
ncbi:hypothetical protein EV360DRAFT_83680 [Lentinula raphanica]|nr:hypothetical protein EV360DRAFT_83680 [Lentinula raphanica]